jgi:ankyrin repeat protein
MRFSRSNKEELVILLLTFGADIDIKDSCGRTALAWAIGAKSIECANILQRAHISKSTVDLVDQMGKLFNNTEAYNNFREKSIEMHLIKQADKP